MSLVEEMHAAHKARLERLGAGPIQAPMVPAEALVQHAQQLRDLQTRVDRQKVIISDLNAIVSKQRKIIRQFADESESPTPRIADIIAVVAEHFNLTKQMVTGSQRTSDIAFPRQIGYYLSRELGYAWTAIGRGFLKDHSSALHGARNVSDRLLFDLRLAEEIETIKTAIDKYVSNRVEASKAMLA